MTKKRGLELLLKWLNGAIEPSDWREIGSGTHNAMFRAAGFEWRDWRYAKDDDAFHLNVRAAYAAALAGENE